MRTRLNAGLQTPRIPPREAHDLRTRRTRLPRLIAAVGFLSLLLFLLFPLPPLKPYSLLIEDRHGEFLHAFLAEDGAWRLRTSPTEIPERLKRILIQKEDKYFYYHPGVNPVALVRALFRNLASPRRVSGASTITMQIARMLERRERTYLNKMIEIFRALQLEWKYSKDELLELYLSMVPLGGNCEGLKSAALIYYQTPLERLNIAQLFDLILIPNDPNDLQPDRNAVRLFEERTKRARPLIAAGFFTEEDSLILWRTAAGATRKPLQRLAPHFCLRVKRDARGESEVRSSLDVRTQKTVETLLSNHLRPWKQRGVHNGAVVVVDNATREIAAYAGSEDFSDAAAHGEVDAVQALRSPGSTLKPLLFAFHMEKGLLTPRSRLLDTPYDAEGFLAENYDGTHVGWVYAEDALRHSLNVPMVRLLHEAGVEPFIEFAAQAGVTSLHVQKAKLGLSLILGGCGVTLQELVGAYAAFPAGGTFAPLTFVHRSGTGPNATHQVFSASTAYMMTEILTGLDRPDIPNNFESVTGLPTIAFKTGTSYGRRDAWSIGYSAEYTVGVWIGNVTHAGNPELVGGKAAAPLLVDIFNSLSTQHQKTILPRPKDIGIREVCAKSGLPPTSRCDHLIDDLYSISRTATRTCDIDKEFLVSLDGKTTFCPSCLGPHAYRVVSYPAYPAELLGFWSTNGKAFVHAPPHNPVCSRLFSGDGPAIISPSEEMTYYLSSPDQKMTLQALSGLDVKEHVWYLNDRYFARIPAGKKLFVSLYDGDHTLACLDDKGRMSAVHVRVKCTM